MIIPFVLIIFSAQALGFHARQARPFIARPARPRTCEANVITPEPVANLQELTGEWYGLYYWYSIADKSSRPSISLNECPTIQVAKATEEAIEAQKVICQNTGQVNFDFDKVELLVQIENHIALIAKGEEYHTSLQYCSYVGRLQILKVSEEVFLVKTPQGGGMMNLFARNVPSAEELECIIDNIGGLEGYIGFPYC